MRKILIYKKKNKSLLRHRGLKGLKCEKFICATTLKRYLKYLSILADETKNNKEEY